MKTTVTSGGIRANKSAAASGVLVSEHLFDPAVFDLVVFDEFTSTIRLASVSISGGPHMKVRG